LVVSLLKRRLIRGSQAARRDRLTEGETSRLAAMFADLATGNSLARPSLYWEELNRMNITQLKDHGFENFRRTIALNYYTWSMLLPWDSQIRFLLRHLPAATTARCAARAITLPRQDYFTALSPVQSIGSKFLSLLLWEYVLTLNLQPELLALRDSPVGNPPVIEPRPGMVVSQDLANSILEYDSFGQAIGTQAVILELGAGYGRNAAVIMAMHPDAKLIIVDIPPALWVAERYLSGLFPGRTAFAYRPFTEFADVADEYAKADLVFLLSTQLELVPRESVDLVINVSSLHEMRPDQIAYYFAQFDRIMKLGGAMYSKQWRKAKVLFEGVTLQQADYPVPPHWRAVFSRIARVQTRFFEALYTKLAARD
jgi:putative sugar O-methyltransferase